MANPSTAPPGMAAQAMAPGSSGQMHPRVPRPSQTGLGVYVILQIIQVVILSFS